MVKLFQNLIILPLLHEFRVGFFFSLCRSISCKNLQMILLYEMYVDKLSCLGFCHLPSVRRHGSLSPHHHAQEHLHCPTEFTALFTHLCSHTPTLSLDASFHVTFPVLCYFFYTLVIHIYYSEYWHYCCITAHWLRLTDWLTCLIRRRQKYACFPSNY